MSGSLLKATPHIRAADLWCPHRHALDQQQLENHHAGFCSNNSGCPTMAGGGALIKLPALHMSIKPCRPSASLLDV